LRSLGREQQSHDRDDTAGSRLSIHLTPDHPRDCLALFDSQRVAAEPGAASWRRARRGGRHDQALGIGGLGTGAGRARGLRRASWATTRFPAARSLSTLAAAPRAPAGVGGRDAPGRPGAQGCGVGSSRCDSTNSARAEPSSVRQPIAA
jgi:hypothetical protein